MTASPSPVLLFIRSLLFALGLIISVVLWGPLVVLSFPLPLAQRYGVSQQWSRFMIEWLRLTCGITCQVSGLEQLPKGPAVMMVKHQSTWETLFLHQLLPPLALVLKRELLWVPFFGWALAQLSPIAIDRKAGRAAFKQVMKQGEACLRRGQWVLIFPEGTRIAPGERGVYGSSGAMLAVNSGYPLLPVAHNAGEFWPRRGFLKRPGTIQLVFGPPFDSRRYKAKELNALAEEWIETTLARISGRPVAPKAPVAPA
jgi:1-acyl-sn-glycerol-3-phosphate acyltransferase